MQGKICCCNIILNIGALMISVNDIQPFRYSFVRNICLLGVHIKHQADEGLIEEFIVSPKFVNKFILLYFMPITASFPIIRLSILEATLDIFSEF